jgi:vancomycin resistance protein VanJ
VEVRVIRSRSTLGDAVRLMPGRLADPALVLAIALVVMAFGDLVVPSRTDLFALSRVLAPYLATLFLPLLLVALLLRGRQRQRLLLVVVVGIGLATLRFVPALPTGAVAADPGAPQLRVATWNLYLDHVRADALVDAIAARAPGIIGLQELTPDKAAVIAADPDLRRRFPHQVLHPADDWSGMGLLSSWPIEGTPETSAALPLIAATVRVPEGRPVDVIVVHAPPPKVRMAALAPTYDPSGRDASLETVLARTDASIKAGRPVVLLGDFNLTDRELAYGALTARLTDAYRAAGTGLGHTWRPTVGDGLPFGVLRIDMVLVGPGLAPVSSRSDCSPTGSDHCVVEATLTPAR